MGGFTEALLKAASRDGSSILNSIPKADRHSHLLLSANYSTYRALRGLGPTHRPEIFDSFASFENHLFSELIPALRSSDGVTRVVRDALATMRNAGVRHIETSIDLFAAKSAGISWTQLVDILEQEMAPYHSDIVINTDLGISRSASKVDWFGLAKDALSTGFFTGIDLYGDERASSAATFESLFKFARNEGLKVKLHTGEFIDGAAAYRECLVAQPDEIQHGLSSLNSREFLTHLVTSQIRVNLAPTSNKALGLASYKNHPIRALFDSGARVTVNTDDFGVFGQTINDEFLNLYEAGLFSASELDRIRLNAFVDE